MALRNGRKCEGETLLKRFFVYKQLDKYQNEYYPDKFLQAYLLARSNVPHFSTKKGICDHIENDKLLKEKSGQFSYRQENRDLFSL